MTTHAITSPALTDALLREAALELLASSTIARYEREAQRLARESGLVQRLRADPDLCARFRARLDESLTDVSRQSLRTPSEFEAAILLCLLVDTEPSEARELVHRAAESPSPWIRSLAMRLTAPSTGPMAPREPSPADLAVAQ